MQLSSIGKYCTLRVFSFLELPQIAMMVGLNTHVNAWLTRAEGFWKKQIIYQVKLKNMTITNQSEIPDARIHINLHFNHILL